eukprot:1087543-Prymnesium_polylepis.1
MPRTKGVRPPKPNKSKVEGACLREALEVAPERFRQPRPPTMLCPGVPPEAAPLECGALPIRCGSRMNPYSLYILHSA